MDLYELDLVIKKNKDSKKELYELCLNYYNNFIIHNIKRHNYNKKINFLTLKALNTQKKKYI